MKPQCHFLIILCILVIGIHFCYAHQPCTKSLFSNDKELNSLIQEVYVYEVPKRYEATKVSICFGLKSKSTGRYYNYIRIGDENKGASAFVEVLSELYESYEDAIEAVSTYKGIIESPEGMIKCDFSQVPKGFGKSFVCNFYESYHTLIWYFLNSQFLCFCAYQFCYTNLKLFRCTESVT